MKNKEVLVLLAAALFLLVAAYTLSRSSAEVRGSSDGGTAAPARAPVVFPRDKPRPTESALAADRASMAPDSRARLDAMQRVLLGGGKDTAIFVEANAIRHSPLMEKILQCNATEAAPDLAQLKNELGIDPMEDLDRIGFDGDVFVASGFFEQLKLPPALGEGTPYGDGSHLWTQKDADGNQVVFARVGNGMILSAADEQSVKAAVDRAEGRGTGNAPAAMPPGMGQGELYGKVGPAFIQELMGQTDDASVQSVIKLVSSSTVQMLVDEDAALSFDLQSPDDKSAENLGAMIEAGLTLLRAEVAKEGNSELAALLEQARVQRTDGGRVALDLAMPGEMLLKGMGCGPDGTPLGKKPASPTGTPASGPGASPPREPAQAPAP